MYMVAKKDDVARNCGLCIRDELGNSMIMTHRVMLLTAVTQLRLLPSLSQGRNGFYFL